jgi:hypothetical protein
MTKQFIPDVTLQDAETALFQEFGKHRATELVRTPTQIEWVILLAPRIRGKATLNQTDAGVSVQLENYWGTSTWVILIICYCLCIIPGIANTLQLMIASGFAARIIPNRVKNIATAMQQLSATRHNGAPTPPPLPPQS